MSSADHSISPEFDELSDEELLARVREGTSAAFAVLYQRHIVAAKAYARRFGNPDSAQDVAQESFLRIFKIVRSGGGPRQDFLGYLMRTARNELTDRARRSRSIAVDEIEDLTPESPDTAEVVEVSFEHGRVQEAFASLPLNWQEVLWYLEVEQLTPRAIAHRLRLSPNAVSQLAVRARAGLKTAWYQSMLHADPARPECRGVVASMSAYLSNRLTAARAEVIRSHVSDCEDCARVLAELSDMTTRRRALLIPVVLASPLLLDRLSDAVSLTSEQHAETPAASEEASGAEAGTAEAPAGRTAGAGETASGGAGTAAAMAAAGAAIAGAGTPAAASAGEGTPMAGAGASAADAPGGAGDRSPGHDAAGGPAGAQSSGAAHRHTSRAVRGSVAAARTFLIPVVAGAAAVSVAIAAAVLIDSRTDSVPGAESAIAAPNHGSSASEDAAADRSEASASDDGAPPPGDPAHRDAEMPGSGPAGAGAGGSDASNADSLHDPSAAIPGEGTAVIPEIPAPVEAPTMGDGPSATAGADDAPGARAQDGPPDMTSPPAAAPTSEPTPSHGPTQSPTGIPTSEPTQEPLPSETPPSEPTPTPTETPTSQPTQEPTPTETPTSEPTQEPTPTPSETPTTQPTQEPTPTETPTSEPTQEPTPTDTPTSEPTPTQEPTPTDSPTGTPTSEPTPEPTPTETPTSEPTSEPTPTEAPTSEPPQVPAPTVVGPAGGSYTTPIRLSGTGEPGATIRVTEAPDSAAAQSTAAEAGSATVGPDGTWAMTVRPGAPDLSIGYAVTQEIAGAVSAPVTLAQRYTYLAPTISEPQDGGSSTLWDIDGDGQADAVIFQLTLTEAQPYAVLVDGERTDFDAAAAGTEREHFVPLSPGEHTIEVAYRSPDTGELGALRRTSFTAVLPQ